jgi:hypothetical protein
VAGSETVARERLAWRRDDVLRATVAQMITVRMGDDGGLHRLPGINVEIPGRAVKTASGDADEGFGIGCHKETLNFTAIVTRAAAIIRPSGVDYNPACRSTKVTLALVATARVVRTAMPLR